MIVVDARHLSGVDLNLSAVVAVCRSQKDGARLGYVDMGRPDHGLCLVKDGGIVFIDTNGQNLTATAGDVVYLPRGKRYTAVFENCGEREERDVLINFHITDDYGRGFSLSDDIFRLVSDADGETVSLFDEIAACCRGGGGVLRVKALTFELMNRLLAAERKESECRSVEDCVAYIDTHYADVTGVGELAALCGLSETAFRKRFREQMGMSPVHYVNAVKVERACRMLRSSEITAADVCERLGFYDLAYFHKVFKRYTGMTPGEYGREYQAAGWRGAEHAVAIKRKNEA